MSQPPTLLLTRPAAQSQAFARTLRRVGWTHPIEISPVLEIVPQAMLRAPLPGTILVFTSANGVAQGVAQHDLAGFTAYCVGDKTARAAQAAGLRATSARGAVGDLLQHLSQAGEGPFLHLRGAHSKGDVAETLKAQGKQAESWVVYDQLERPLTAKAQALFDRPGLLVVPLFSPRSAQLLSGAAQRPRATLRAIAISAAAAAAWTGEGPACVVPLPNGAQMRRAILKAGGGEGPCSRLVGARSKS